MADEAAASPRVDRVTLRLTARAIREGKNLEMLAAEILDRRPDG